ncbi:hypothetical protein J8I26_15730, partial [Herbaspirillum sp. LeCh32-8]|nr:hypothetical protein [Herbaspirillum sp. LeCh32-8]
RPCGCLWKAVEGGSIGEGQFCEQINKMQTILLKRPGGDREMVEILALVMFHDEKAVLSAVETALASGAPSKQIVLNVLSRLLDETPAPKITAPQALQLCIEPAADVGRYDTLRTKEDDHVDAA